MQLQIQEITKDLKYRDDELKFEKKEKLSAATKFENTIANLEGEVRSSKKDARSEKNKSNAQIKELKNKTDTLREDERQTRRKLEESDERVREMSSRIETQNAEIDLLRQENNDQKANLWDTEEQLKRAQETVDQLQKIQQEKYFTMARMRDIFQSLKKFVKGHNHKITIEEISAENRETEQHHKTQNAEIEGRRPGNKTQNANIPEAEDLITPSKETVDRLKIIKQKTYVTIDHMKDIFQSSQTYILVLWLNFIQLLKSWKTVRNDDQTDVYPNTISEELTEGDNHDITIKHKMAMTFLIVIGHIYFCTSTDDNIHCESQTWLDQSWQENMTHIMWTIKIIIILLLTLLPLHKLSEHNFSHIKKFRKSLLNFSSVTSGKND